MAAMLPRSNRVRSPQYAVNWTPPALLKNEMKSCSPPSILTLWTLDLLLPFADLVLFCGNPGIQVLSASSAVNPLRLFSFQDSAFPPPLRPLPEPIKPRGPVGGVGEEIPGINRADQISDRHPLSRRRECRRGFQNPVGGRRNGPAHDGTGADRRQREGRNLRGINLEFPK